MLCTMSLIAVDRCWGSTSGAEAVVASVTFSSSWPSGSTVGRELKLLALVELLALFLLLVVFCLGILDCNVFWTINVPKTGQ